MTRSDYRRLASRTGALVIAALALVVVWAVLIDPVVSAWQDKSDQIDRAAELIGRLRRTAAEAPAVQQELATLGEAERDHGAVLVAANPNLAGAALQAEIKRLAEADGAELRSIQQLPPSKQDAATRISVRAELESDTAQLSRLLYDIEAHSPALLVRGLSVHGNEQQAASQPQSPQQPTRPPAPLGIQLEITAFTGPPE